MDNSIKTTGGVAGVRFHDNWKVYDFDASEIEVSIGDKVIVDSDRGPGVAQVVRIRKTQEPRVEEVSLREAVEAERAPDAGEAGVQRNEPAPGRAAPTRGLRKVLRRATQEDLAREEKNRARESEAFNVAHALIAERELPMKLIRAEYSFDASRATFFFFSEARVDFRDLVKDLAFKLKNRIEMRQIGVRDVARMVGGFGPCGRELCCSAFLKNFEPVSIRMAKKQEMVLNPAKISGVCGRLLCCLSYEFEMYDENKKDLASLRETAFKDKKAEEELRAAEERKESDERRAAEEKRRREERKPQQEQQRDRPRESGGKGGRQDKKRGRQQDKKAQQPGPEQAGERQPPKLEKKQSRPEPTGERLQAKPEKQRQQPEQPRERRQPKPEAPLVDGQEKAREQTPEPGAQPQRKDGEALAGKKRRRFWRRKKKGPQGEGGPSGPTP